MRLVACSPVVPSLEPTLCFGLFRFLAEFILITVTVFWGGTFPLVKDAIREIPVMAFLWIRFALAALILFLWAGPAQIIGLGKKGWARGIGLGAQSTRSGP